MNYISKLVFIHVNCGFEEFSSLWAKLSWTTNSKSDMSCGVALLILITDERFKDSKTEFTNNNNNVVLNLNKCSDVLLSFSTLNKKVTRIQDYADA